MGLEKHPDYIETTSGEELASSRMERERSGSGLRIYGTAGFLGGREPQFVGGLRKYTSILGSLGLRYPLLGSAGEERLRVGYARIDTLLAGAQRQFQRTRLLQLLRVTYHGYDRADAQLALTRFYLRDAQAIREILERRVQAHLLLDADRRELELGLAQGERREAAASAELEQLGTELRRWREDFGGRVIHGAGGELPPIDEKASVEALATLSKLEKEVNSAGTFVPLRANAYLAATAHRDDDIGRGVSVGAGLTFEVPIEALALKRAVGRESRAYVRRAINTLVTLRDTASRWHGTVAQEQASVAAEVRHARAAAEASGAALEETSRRASLKSGIAGDPIERWVRARNGHYSSLLNLLDAEARAWALGGEAKTAATSACSLPSVAYLGWQSLLAEPGPACEVRQILQAPAEGLSAKRAVYAWGGLATLQSSKAKEALDELQVSDLWLSFSAKDLKQLSQPKTRQRTASKLREQQQRGRRVVLLLGDSEWLRSGQEASLLAVVRDLADLPFDALHLDLEPGQLTPAQEQGAEQDAAWVALGSRIAELRTETKVPIQVSVNWRALTPDAEGRCAACAAVKGADEISVMLYSTALASVRERMARIAAVVRDKPLWLAQSIEPELSGEESHFKAGRASLRARLDEFQDPTSQGRLSRVAIQSLETYMSAKP